MSPPKAIGFTNDQNFCFLITCLQCLLSIDEMTDYFVSKQYNKDWPAKRKTELKFCAAYTELIMACHSNNYSFRPKAIIKLSKKNFAPDDEHDSQEFLRFFLSGLEDELNKKNQNKFQEWNSPMEAWEFFTSFQTSIINKLFSGMFVNRVKCTNCKNVSESYDLFLDISLSI